MHTLHCIFHYFTVTVSAQDDPNELVICYQRAMCSNSGLVDVGVTFQACCDNLNGGGLDGIGLGASFQLDGVEECFPCPIG